MYFIGLQTQPNQVELKNRGLLSSLVDGTHTHTDYLLLLTMTRLVLGKRVHQPLPLLVEVAAARNNLAHDLEGHPLRQAPTALSPLARRRWPRLAEEARETEDRFYADGSSVASARAPTHARATPHPLLCTPHPQQAYLRRGHAESLRQSLLHLVRVPVHVRVGVE